MLLALAAVAALAASPPPQHPYDDGASWSPDSRRIAFLHDERLRIMSTEGGRARAYRCGSVDVWITATTIICAARGYLVVVNVDTGAMRRVVRDAFEPAPSPDGTVIAFTRWRPNGDSETIWSIRTNGRGLRRLGPGLNPAWSPDGTRLAFATRGARHQIATMNADGTGIRVLTHARDNARPRWSPNGEWIAWQRALDSDLGHSSNVHVFAMHPDGTGIRDVVDPPVLGRRQSDTFGFCWSPASDAIVYDTDNPDDPAVALDGDAELWIGRLDGSRPTFLIKSGTGRSRSDDYYPAWSPDGSTIAFERLYEQPAHDGGLYGSIMSVRADGTRLRRLTR